MKILGGDCGNYTVIPSAQRVFDLRALGLDFFVVGTSYGTVAEAQIAAFAAGGMTIEEYQFPAKLKPTQRPWWVDAELPDATQASLRSAMVKGSLGPYTRRGWWQSELGGWNIKAEFPHAKLFDARYVHGDGPCLIASAVKSNVDVKAAIIKELSWLTPFKPYGGFTEATITQWHNSIVIAGVNMDLNIREKPEPEEEDDDMKPIRIWCPERGKTYLVGPFGAIAIDNPADDKTLEKLYGSHAGVLSGATLDALK